MWHRVGLDAWNIARPAVFLIDQDGSIPYSFVGDNQGEYPDAARDPRGCRRVAEDLKMWKLGMWKSEPVSDFHIPSIPTFPNL